MRFRSSTLKILLIICASLLVQYKTLAQKTGTKDKEFNKILSAADDHVLVGEYLQAQQLYLMAWQKEKNTDLSLKIARLYFSINRETKAIPYLEFATQNGIRSLELARMLGIAYHRAYRFPEAEKWINSILANTKEPALLQEAQKLLLHTKHAQSTAMDLGRRLTLTNLGPLVNSMYDDYSPVLTADERILYFTSRRHTSTGAEKDETGFFYEDIYRSVKTESGWTSAENVGAPINTEEHDATAGIAPNGDELFIYRADKGGDLFMSAIHKNRWSDPENLGDNVNSAGWETSISTTPDENIIFFSSNRKGSMGGKDIYFSTKLSNGNWNTPVQLGSEINTVYDEESPFIHPDGKTLYFSSEGHNSIGGYDIFRCEIDLKTGRITSPVTNLGFPISDVGDDVFFVWSADNKRAYFSSDREGGYGLKDIYMADLDYHRKSEIQVLRIQALDTLNRHPIHATIELTDLETGEKQMVKNQQEAAMVMKNGHRYELLANADGYCPVKKTIVADSSGENLDINMKPQYRKTELIVKNDFGKGLKAKIKMVDLQTNDDFLVSDDSRDGVYSIYLKEGGKYSIEILEKGYSMIHSEVDIPRGGCDELVSDTNFNALKLNFQLKSLQVGQYEILEAIYFASGKIKPLPESYKQLDFVADFLSLNPSIKAAVNAHSDEIGSPQFNLSLSQQRAEEVVRYLIAKGIASERLVAKGYGEERPIDKGKTEGSRKLNRRVEFMVLEK